MRNSRQRATSPKLYGVLLGLIWLLLWVPASLPSLDAQEGTQEPIPVDITPEATEDATEPVEDVPTEQAEPEPTEPAVETTPESILPEATAEVTADAAEATPEATAEVTAEAAEATPETTEAAEATPEATAEVTAEAVEATPETTEAAEATLEATAEVTAEAAEATPEAAAEGEIVLTADFETAPDAWIIGEGATIAPAEDANQVLLMAPGTTFAPMEARGFSDYEVAGRVQFLTEDAGLSLHFGAYTATLSLAQISVQDEAVVLGSAEAAYALNTWYAFSLRMTPNGVTMAVAGVDVLSVEAALAPADFGFVAAGNVTLDDVVVTNYAPLVELVVEEAAETTLDAVRSKLDGNLVWAVELSQTTEPQAFVRTARDYGMIVDEVGRIAVSIYVQADHTVDDVLALLPAFGAERLIVSSSLVIAYMPIENLVEFASEAAVAYIETSYAAASTGFTPADAGAPSGTTVTYGYDMLGIEDWHAAGVTGSGVRIGVIDGNFKGSVAGAEYACLAERTEPLGLSDSPEPGHGLNVVQILCDIAPDSDVYTYTVPTDDNVVLRDAIRNARNDGMDVIVIALDMGVDNSAGDGTESSGIAEDPYAELLSAREEGIIVFASAGNNGALFANDLEADPNRISRYAAINVGLDETVTVTMKATDQDRINISWNDWQGTNSGGELEDFEMQLTYNQSGTQERNPNRNSNNSSPAQQFTIASSGDCTRTTATPTPCDVTLTITNVAGNASSVVQVQIVPVQDNEPSLPLEVQTLSGVRITGVTGGSLVTGAGTLARPADSPDVVAVGAVCAYGIEGSNFALSPESSVGPVYGSNGAAPLSIGNLNTPGNRASVKPEIVSVAHGQTSIAPANPAAAANCDGTVDNLDNIGGLSGTSSAVAHAAGMAALLRSNTSNGAMAQSFSNVGNLQTYIQTRVIELPIVTPNGFDYTYGAGFAALGNPRYNVLPGVDGVLVYTSEIPDLLGAACSSYKFVGQGPNLAGPQYIHPSLALSEATPTDCVIFNPGEYITPFYADNTNARGIYAYDAVDGDDLGESTIRVLGEYFSTLNDNRGGLYIANTDGFVVEGFTIYGKTVRTGSAQGSAAGLMIENSIGVVIDSNNIGAATVDGVPYPAWTRGDATVLTVFGGSSNVITNNVFDGNRGGFVNGDTHYPGLEAISTTGLEVTLNAFRNNTISGQDGASPIFSSVVGMSNTDAAIASNTFVGNSASAVVATSGGTGIDLVSNVFLSNVNGLLATGPLVQTNGAADFRFVSNTVARNTRTAGKGAIIGFGPRTGGTGLGGAATFDFFNNVVYSNTIAQGIIVDMASTTAITQCDPIAGAVDTAVQHNIWFGNGTTPACATALNAAGNDNLQQDPLPNFAGEQAGVNLNATTDARYYGLIEAATFGVDDGDAALFTPGYVAPFNEDANGQPRTTGVIDRGAYEFSKLTFNDGNLDGIFDIAAEGGITYTEDEGPFLIDLEDIISGGFGTISLSVDDGLPGDAEYPANFGTQCGGTFTAENRGVVDAFGLRLRYCPPADFYTENPGTPGAATFDDTAAFAGEDRYSYTETGNTNWPDFVDFTVRAIDEAGSIVYGQVRLQIAAAADQPLTASIGDGTPTGDVFSVTGNVGSTVTVQLRPFVSFNNFTFSERSNEEFFDAVQELGEQFQVDYPFSYNISTAQTDAIVTDITVVDAVAGIVELTLGDVEGETTITYTVDDAQSGSPTVNTITVSTVNRIPNTPGTYDDSSFAWDYSNEAGTTSGEWIPRVDAAAINNTLHRTNSVGDTASFGFEGTGFVLYMKATFSGGLWDLAINGTSVSGWAQIGNVTPQVYEGTAGDFTCTTTAIDRLANPLALTNFGSTFYRVTCNTAVDVPAATHVVEIKNLVNLRELLVDAFAIINDNDITDADLPLPPGQHDVDALAVRDAFGADWVETAFFSYSGGIGYTLPGPVTQATADNVVSFLVSQGTGFAIETTIESKPPRYAVCVTNITSGSDEMTCQRYDHTPPSFLFLTNNVFRPFYGLSASASDVYRVDIIPISIESGSKLVIDGIRVFEANQVSQPFSGAADDANLEKFVFGGGKLDNWQLDTRFTTNINSTLTSVLTTVRAPGPYVSFKTDAGVDLVYWTFRDVFPSAATMVCVDRGVGVGTATTPISDTVDVDSAHGNCIVVNLQTGSYVQVGADGVESPPAAPAPTNLISGKTLSIPEAAFREPWAGTGSEHVFEIFNLYTSAMSVDEVTAIDSSAPLVAGTYADSALDLFDFFAFDGANYNLVPPENVEVSTSSLQSSYTGEFTLLTSFAAFSDKDGTVLYTDTVNNVIQFEFEGSGFAPFFRLNSQSDLVEVCYDERAQYTTVEALFDTASGSVCQTFNNKGFGFKVPRAIHGLPYGEYVAGVRFLGDIGDDSFLTVGMWFDGVEIFGQDYATLNALPNGTRSEGNYANRSAENKFFYFGTGWTTTTGIAAANYSAQNYDRIFNQFSPTVGFRVQNANSVTLTRDLGFSAPQLLACATEVTNASNRVCSTIDSSGFAYQVDFTFYLNESGANGDYIVTLAALSNGTFNFDAVQPNSGTGPIVLTAGQYDDNNPAIVYGIGDTWRPQSDLSGFGGRSMESQTEGASFKFAFDGTGFGLNLNLDQAGGEVEVCYEAFDPTTTNLGEVVFGDVDSTCVTYQNEVSGFVDSLRLIEGLADLADPQVYAVRVQDVEDGKTVLGFSPDQDRLSFYSPARIDLDSLVVFDTQVPVVEAGTYGESAVDANSGTPYLQLVPDDKWGTITGFLANSYSGQSYVTLVDAFNNRTSFLNGPAAIFNLDLATHSQAQVIVDVNAASFSASDQLLACVDGVDGVVTRTGNTYTIVDNNGPQNCIILNSLKTSDTIALTQAELPLLGVGGTNRKLTLQTLTNGIFQIDGYQVFYGTQPLEPGLYQESVGYGVLDTSASPNGSADWPRVSNFFYNDGFAFVTKQDAAQIDFSFTGTGISLITTFGSSGGVLDVTINGPVTINEQVDTRSTTTYYGTAATFAGLPHGTYTVTIVAALDTNEQVVLDAVEVYGALQQLGSLYDDAQTNVAGTPLITYGPNNAAWQTQVGFLASTALNRTLHTAQKFGAVASFEIGAVTPATGIVLYYRPAFSAVPVEVCFRDAASPATAPTCFPDVSITDQSGVATVDGLPAGHYFVTIENKSFVSTSGLALDAIQVLEDGVFAEGIYRASSIAQRAGGTFTQANSLIDIAAGNTISFANVSGIGLSFVWSAASSNYDLCISEPGLTDCTIVDESYTDSRRALTLMGLHDSATADEDTFDVQLTNTGTTTLRLKELHVLGDDDALTIADSQSYENDAVQIRQFPFGSAELVTDVLNRSSGGNQSVLRNNGSTFYFEFIGDATTGFQYVREGSTLYGVAEICVGRVGVENQVDVAADCQAISNTSPTGFGLGTTIDPDLDCSGEGCWVTITNVDGRALPLDSVRTITDGQPLIAGRYQNTDAISLKNFYFSPLGTPTIDDTALNVQTENNSFASGGSVRTYTDLDTDDKDSALKGGMYFTITGTGATVNFTLDSFADAVQICYAPFGGGFVSDADLANALDGNCQTFDNQSLFPVYNVARRVVGLPQDTYLFVVQMLEDNYRPSGHTALQLPLRMKIDAVEVHDDDAATLTALPAGTRTETGYATRVSDNRFFYYGSNWSAVAISTASGRGYDSARQAGATVVFRTTGADALNYITPLSSLASEVRLCAISTADGSQHCQDILPTGGFGAQRAIPFDFDGNVGEYIISVQALSNSSFIVDAIAPAVTQTLEPGLYEETHPSILYNTEYENLVPNGTMETDAAWTTYGQADAAREFGSFQGIYSWGIEGGIGSGIQSQPFDMSEPGVYTFIARVRVTDGVVRFRLTDEPPLFDFPSGEVPSISEFTEITQGETGFNFVTVRQTIVIPDSAPASYQGVALQILSDGSNGDFNVDDVSVVYGGQWKVVDGFGYTNGTYMQSQTHAASFQFAFNGTGFQLGMGTSRDGGEVEMCYDDDATFDDDADPTPQSCFTYQQEDTVGSTGIVRTVAGLTDNTYYVRVRDVEDGRTVTRLNNPDQPRTSFTGVGKINLDFVRILGDEGALPPSVATGSYNEDATDGADTPYLKLLPEADWATIADFTATNASGQSYVGVVDNFGRVASFQKAGQVALLNATVPSDDGASVVIYLGTSSFSNTDQLLICVGGRMSGEISWNGSAFSLQDSTDCVLRNTVSTGVVVVSDAEIAALGTAGSYPIMVTSLADGQFTIDGYQIIDGTTLPPGFYDDFLPDDLLDFTTASRDSVNPAAFGCSAAQDWCTVKTFGTFGPTSVFTSAPDATLEFDVEGTGFSVFTALAFNGVDMRICYQKTPANGGATFPATSATINAQGQPIWDNSAQDLANGGVWCDILTTQTGFLSPWEQLTPDRLQPFSAANYGFSYYGLPFDQYTVEVRLVDTNPGLNRLTIDGIAVFQDRNDLPIIGPGFYDDAEATLSFEPTRAWTTPTSFSSPPFGPFQKREHKTTVAGAVAQMRVQGNALTIFQTMNFFGTDAAQICLVISDATIHCTREANIGVSDIAQGGEPSSELAVELASFSQNSAVQSYFAPILYYGLGAGVHDIIIENRDHSGSLTIDAILVQE